MIRLRDEAASISSPPSQLPSASRREDRPEVTLPPWKRLGIALGPRYEVGESSSAAAARPTRGFRADYGFVATVDREIMHDPEREVSYRITDLWDEIVETLQGAPVMLSSPVEDKPFELEFMPFLVMTEGCETVIGFILELALTVLGTFFASLETLSGLILNMPGVITLSLFTPLDSCGVGTEFEVTGFDKAFVSPILGSISTIGCFANLVFALKSCVLSF
nr:hypothetical protein [Tanacetum cinerariifolium]GFB58929.1 hypothetical protein [Tanacetum cinerariifolium]